MTEISEAAKAKAAELINAAIPNEQFRVWNAENIDEPNRVAFAFGRFIQEVSDAAKAANPHVPPDKSLAPFILPEPVDPLLIEARKVAAGASRWSDDYRETMLNGGFDDTAAVRTALAALKRGFELGRQSCPQ